MTHRCIGVYNSGRILVTSLKDARISEFSLAMISAPVSIETEPFAFAARDLLRRLLVGNDVWLHVTFKTSAVVVVGDPDSLEGNAAIHLLRAGFATFVPPPSKRLTDLELSMSRHYADAESAAHRKCLGIHNQALRAADHIRAPIPFPVGQENKLAQRLLSSHLRHMSVRGTVEKVLSCSVMEVAIIPSLQMIVVRVGGVVASENGFSASRMALQEAVLHRPQTFTVEDFDESTEMFLVSFSCDALVECIADGTAVVDRKSLHLSRYADVFLQASRADNSSIMPSPPKICSPYEGIVVGVPDEVSLLVTPLIDPGAETNSSVGVFVRLAFLGAPKLPVRNPSGKSLIFPRDAFFTREELRRRLIGQQVTVVPVCKQQDGTDCARVYVSRTREDEEECEQDAHNFDLIKLVMTRNPDRLSLVPVTDAEGAVHLPEVDLVTFSLQLQLIQESSPAAAEPVTLLLADSMPSEAFNELSKGGQPHLAVVEHFRQPNCVHVRIVDVNVLITIALDGIRVARVDNDVWLNEIHPFIHRFLLNRECYVSLTRFCSKTERIFGFVQLQIGDLAAEMLRRGFGIVRGMLQNIHPAKSQSLVFAQREAAASKIGIFSDRYAPAGKDLHTEMAQRIPISLVDGFPMTRIVPLAYSSPMTFTYREFGPEVDKILKTIRGQIDGMLDSIPKFSKLREGDIVAARYDEEFYRAKITALNNGEDVSIFYLDYGTTASVSVRDIRVAKSAAARKILAEIPPLAKVAQHAFVTYRKFDHCRKHLENHMQRIVNCPTLLMKSFYMRAGILHVVLFDDLSPPSRFPVAPPIVVELMVNPETRPYVTVGVEYADVIEVFDFVEALIALDLGADRSGCEITE